MKKNNKKGFTLAELLIVVAIIAVLTAVAIPIFTAQLEKSREETDIANMRAAKAAAVAYFLDNADDTKVYFNAATGAVQKDATGITGYGKGTTTEGNGDSYEGYYKGQSYKDEYVIVEKKVTSGIESLSVYWSGTHTAG